MLHLLVTAAEVTVDSTLGADILQFVKDTMGAVTTAVPLSVIMGIIAAIITAGLGIYITWKFGRKGFKSIVSVLTGGKLKF